MTDHTQTPAGGESTLKTQGNTLFYASLPFVGVGFALFAFFCLCNRFPVLTCCLMGLGMGAVFAYYF